MKTFTVTKEHLILLQNSYTSWEDSEFGAAGINTKRPYGNGSVMQDMLKLLNIDCPKYKETRKLPWDLQDKLNQLHRDIEI
jgi:hypothetical protein